MKEKLVNTIKALENAYEVLKDEKRWVKGDFALFPDPHTSGAEHIPTEGAFCAIGAVNEGYRQIRRGSRDRWDYWRIRSAATSALAETLASESMNSIPDFNDNEATTHATVLSLFERTIARLRTQIPKPGVITTKAPVETRVARSTARR